jgi:hypothetical protein
MTRITGMRAVMAVKGAMADRGLSRTSRLAGAEIAGWIAPNRFGSTGLSIRRQPDGDIVWHVVLSGKPHLKYRNYREVQGDETIEVHEPIDPQRLFPALRQVFEGLGIDVVGIELGGYQTHWDDDVSYNVVTKRPEWLDVVNGRGRPEVDPVLVTCRMSDRPQAPVRGLTGLVAYQTLDGLVFLTRESIGAIAARMDEVRRYAPETGTLAIDGTGELVRTSRGQTETVSRPSTIVNFKGDEIEVWAVPGFWVIPEIEFDPKVPFVLEGETCRNARFAVLDEQYGPAPWSETPSASPKP